MRAGSVPLAAGPWEATFEPERGMLGTSLRYEGEELLAQPGMPLLFPWANRLGALRYRAGDVAVDLRGVDLPADPNGLPIHGTGARAFTVVEQLPDRLVGRVVDDLGPAFPFPHALTVEARLDDASLTVTTTLAATGRLPVPLSFGWHPWFRAVPSARLRLPARRHLALDARGLPTGTGEDEAAEAEPLHERTFDDLYEVEHGAALGIGALTVAFEHGYPYAQVYRPRGEGVVCLEPMTAPTNALVEGRCALVEPGGSSSARFSVVVEGS